MLTKSESYSSGMWTNANVFTCFFIAFSVLTQRTINRKIEIDIQLNWTNIKKKQLYALVKTNRCSYYLHKYVYKSTITNNIQCSVSCKEIQILQTTVVECNWVYIPQVLYFNTILYYFNLTIVLFTPWHVFNTLGMSYFAELYQNKIKCIYRYIIFD